MTLTLTVALAAGVVALILFWSALLTGHWTLAGVSVVYCLFAAAGVIVWFARRRVRRSPLRDAAGSLTRIEWGAIALIGVIAAAILFNSAYFPFSRPDALGIYRPAALDMFQRGSIQPLIGAESLYRAYPILVPLNYAMVYTLAGWEQDYLAKTVVALLSLGCLPAVFLLGREIGTRRTGLLAALILALTPAFVRWASSGYVDLPMAFYYTLAATFALRFWRNGAGVDAALAGLMMGFAAFTKNAALLGVPLLAIWLAASLWKHRHAHELSRRLGATVLSLALCGLIAAPWYIRNLIGAGFLIPDTAWTDQAERSLRTLGIFITLTDNFLASGWLILLGVAFSAVRLAQSLSNRRRPEPHVDGHALLLWFTVPFFAAWWIFVSYDPRFLLLFTPILCVSAALAIEVVLQRLRPGRIVQAALIAAALGISLYCMFISVEFKDEIVRDPLMSHEAKVALVRGQ
ncbi:MAG: glycosyltransferase family 39 protein [Chloroflexi bacterium]|nr:glycosyltransferase family 39 protein [Chloroflexota bacterium]